MGALTSRWSIAVLVMLTAVWGGPLSVSAQSAPANWDADAQRWHAAALRAGSAPEGAVSILRLEGSWESAPDRTLSLLHALGGERRIGPLLRARARHGERWLLWRSGRLDEATRVVNELGYVRRFRMLGPFANPGRRGLATTMPPEASLSQPTDPNAEVPGAERPIRWRTPPTRDDTGFVFLAPFLTPSADVCVFLETFVRTERAEQVTLLVGATGAVRAYWNDALAVEETRYLTADLDRHAARVDARAGFNRLLLKVCSDDRPPAVVVRVARADGTPMQVTADPSGTLSPAPATPVTPASSAPVVTPFAALEARVTASPDDAVALETLARFLHATGGEDPTGHRIRDLATHAAEVAPTAENLLFAAARQETRDDRGRLLRQAVALAPDDPAVLLEHAFFVGQGASGERALAMLEAIPPRTIYGLIAQSVRAGFLENLGFGETALALRADLARRAPQSIVYLRARLEDAHAEGRTSVADTLAEQLLARVHDDPTARARLLDRALAREERSVVESLLAEDLRMRPYSGEALARASRVYEALGDTARSIALLTQLTELDPDDPSARVVLGRALLDLGQRGPALAAFREALRLRPQDTETRDLVESLAPEARPDEAFAASIEDILQRRTRGTDFPGTILHDLEVRTVHPTGLSSAFHQRAFQVSTDEGARGLREHAIRYEPSTQWVDVRSVRVYRGDDVLSSYELGERSLAEPEFRIYYSARDVVVSLPELRPGDVIELRYRVDDVTARNEYEGHFGTLRGLQAQLPIRRIEQVFFTPSARPLTFNTPSIPMRHETRTEGGTRVDRFVADDVEPLRAEPSMPGYMEIAPYLHASTFGSWQEVGRFWWGLAETQLAPDAQLERTVRELIADAPDTRTKVARIYAWAIDHVRYVGLELGIHGHQPYPVADVVARGFGDCKDTASLLYTMLRIANIDARIVLVRTRRLGELPDAPASLAVFDHAIAYVPELRLYLDGTSERSGIEELPQMDQGAVGLVVGPSTAEMVRLPVLAADAQGRRREITVTLSRDGSVAMRGREELRGAEAVSARARYGPEETRRERLEEAIGRIFPGVSVAQQEFSVLTDREQPVRYSWGGSAQRFGEREGGDLLIAPTVVQDLTRAWALLPQRRFPIVMGTPFHYRERRVVELGGLRATEVPRSGEVTTPFARVTVRYATSATAITVDTEVVLTRERLSVAEYPALRRFTEQADALLRARIRVSGLEGTGGAR